MSDSIQNEMVKYEGRIVPKAGFRVFVYGANGEKYLANSWQEFEKLMQSGIWFSNEKAASEIKKRKKKGD